MLVRNGRPKLGGNHREYELCQGLLLPSRRGEERCPPSAAADGFTPAVPLLRRRRGSSPSLDCGLHGDVAREEDEQAPRYVAAQTRQCVPQLRDVLRIITWSKVTSLVD